MLIINHIHQKLWLIIVSIWMLLSPYSIYSNNINKPIVKIDSSFTQTLQFLKEKLKNVEFYDDAIDTIIEIYGKPSRYLGSMDPTPQWDIEGGFLTCSYLLGVMYSPKSNFNIFDEDTIFLIDTANRVDENLTGIYHLFSLPRDNSRLLGNLELKTDGQYHFNITTKGLDMFFLNHPDGSYTIEYQPNIKPADLLENIKRGTKLAKLTFQAKDNSYLYSLYFCIEGRAIVTKPTNKNSNNYEFVGYFKNPYYKRANLQTFPPFELFKTQIKTAENANEAYKIIRKTYGEAQRVIRDIEVWPHYQWDVDGGVLSYNYLNGVSYEKKGQRIYLIDTQNKIGKTVIGYYSMYALMPPDKADKIPRFLGSVLRLKTNGQYELETSGPYKYAKKNSQNDIFFFRYPSGTYTLTYQKGINPDELLENMKDGTVLGKIDFASGRNRESFYIYIKERRLVSKPVDGKPRTYMLLRYWENYYQKNDGTK